MGILRVGVTGHRILPPNHGLEAGIQSVLRIIAESYPGKEWTVYSSLAEGADCLFLQYALRRPKVTLAVPLPLPEHEYLEDFQAPQSRSLFRALLQQAGEVIALPTQQNREAAYEAAGKYLVDHSDVLVAIWDGKEAQGIGGTGWVVALARRKGLPLAWILAGNRRPGTHKPTLLADQQGKVYLERFPSGPSGTERGN